MVWMAAKPEVATFYVTGIRPEPARPQRVREGAIFICGNPPSTQNSRSSGKRSSAHPVRRRFAGCAGGGLLLFQICLESSRLASFNK